MNSTSGSRKSVADDEFKRRAMDAYQAKGKSATMNAASSMKARSASTRHAMRDRSDSESSLSSESEMSDSDSDASGASPRGRGRRRRGRHRDDSLSSESDGEDKRQVRATEPRRCRSPPRPPLPCLACGWTLTHDTLRGAVLWCAGTVCNHFRCPDPCATNPPAHVVPLSRG